MCIRRVADPTPESELKGSSFGFSGLDITILDYGLSRARLPCPLQAAEEGEEGYEAAEATEAVAYDLERDLSLFTSDHAPQCAVYRQMRSFWLSGGERGVCLPSQEHREAYALCPTPYPSAEVVDDDGTEEESEQEPLCWSRHEPYTNVLWLAYLYQFMTGGIAGSNIAKGIPRRQLTAFKKATAEFWGYLDPSVGDIQEDEDEEVLGFGSASDVVRFAVEAGWVAEEQLTGGVGGGGANRTLVDADRSIFSILSGGRGGGEEDGDRSCLSVRRSPRRLRKTAS